MRIKKISLRGFLVDPIPISQNKHYKNVWCAVRRITIVFRSISTKVTGHVNFKCISS